MALALGCGGGGGGDGDAGGDGDGGGGTDAGGDAGPCTDECPAPGGGITIGCRTRFAYGVNYAWHDFGGDFGGVTPWGIDGVAARTATYGAELADMKAHGASLVRWWMFPDFRGDGVQFDGSDAPTGLGATTLADVGAALQLAADNDLYLMLTIFSFDNFRPTRDEAGIRVRGLRPMIRDAGQRQDLLDLVVAPIAAAVEASPHRDRMLAWDVINEPEWAITGASLYGGDQDFDPNGELEPVSHAEMEAFLADVITVLRANSSAQISIGATAFKWAHAWQNLDTDFHQFHMYEWIDTYWPHDNPPSTYDLDDKPVVMGEFPLGNLTATDPYLDVLDAMYTQGYAGALGWQYNEATPDQLTDMATFATAHPCDAQL